MEQNKELYYVPDQSKLPIFASIGLFLTVFGMGNWLNQIKNDSDGPGLVILIAGFLLLAFVLFTWFSTVIDENIRGMNNAQVKRSYVWGIGWFIFSEVMFFAAFFGALYYLRNISLEGLSSELTSEILWNGFEAEWPLLTTPDMALNVESAVFVGPHEGMGWAGWDHLLNWLPFWNTVILLSSSVTVHIAHTALLKDKKSRFSLWLGITVLLGVIFLCLQALEYYEAVHEYGITLGAGDYGTTFFMLTGFHGFHVFLGTFMLFVQWLRSVTKGHFTHDDCFGFEASSWYWHFVDVVWVGLFLFVYVLG